MDGKLPQNITLDEQLLVVTMCLCHTVEKLVDCLAKNSHGCYNDLEIVGIDN